MSTEEIPLLTGDDETGEQIEMRNLNLYDSSTSSSSRSTVISRHSTQEESSFGGDASETTSLFSRRKVLMMLGIELKENFQTLIRLSHLSLLA